MQQPPDDRVERLIRAALARDAREQRAPDGFADRVEERLYFVRLLERQRARVRSAWLTTFGGAIALAGVAALFTLAIDVPGWVVENVPGALGRLDALAIRMDAARLPALLTIAGGAAAAIAWAGLRLFSRRAKAMR